jgi:UDP-N-acetylmuramate dehydrogenase
MEIHSNVSLKDLNTFKVDVNAKSLLTIDSHQDFTNKKILKHIRSDNHIVIGGGSNILFTKDYTGIVVLIRNKGKKVVDETSNDITVEVNAGENFNEFVKWSVDRKLMGLHNLALIPGTIGAVPIQNVGAYNTEIKEYITQVKYLNLKCAKEEILRNSECKFKYRDSIFRKELKNKVIVKSVTFKLQKYLGEMDRKYLQYEGIAEILQKRKATPTTMYNAIKKIREKKLPKIEEYGSCGSTFKNPEIPLSEYNRLLSSFPQLPKYDTKKRNIVKIPAAYLLEKFGWKNRRDGQVGTWKHHPLIVTNYGNAKAEDILSFIQSIQKDFKAKTCLDLECEINII